MTTAFQHPSAEPAADLGELVDSLMDSYEAGPRPMHHLGAYELPQMSEVVQCFEELRVLLFPGFVGDPLLVHDGGAPARGPIPLGRSRSSDATRQELRANVHVRVGNVSRRLRRQIFRGLHHRCRQDQENPVLRDCTECDQAARRITHRFLGALPEMRAVLWSDVDAHYEGDPAARGTDEVIFCYPGLYAITAYRLAHRLWQEGAAIIPRMLTEHAHEKTGIDIHPGAEIGKSFFIDHGTGIVIGETTCIGERVRIYQGVTLGALSLPTGTAHTDEGKKRHPTIEDDVILYANATILGGNTIVGKGAVIGGNCWVTRSVAPGERLTVRV